MEHAVHVHYLRWIVLLPLVGAVLNGVTGAAIQRAGGKRAISIIACTPVVVAFLISLRAVLQLLRLEPEQRMLLDPLWTWISVGTLNVDVAFQVDPLSAVMILVVTGVGGLIHIYSTGYMHDDKSYWRFFAFLNLFTFAMLTLVLADNLLLMFVGWEGVGLCSYALIGFWYSEINNASAGSKAFIVNRVGDFGFTLGAFLLFWTLNNLGHATLTFRELQEHAHLLDGQMIGSMSVVTAVTLLFFVGATGKSAQIPLYVWLPDAMAGPTPVSALIHAATMVTAGVYMIGRTNFLFSMAPTTLHVVAWIGALTAFFAATIGVCQNDIKRVLAYSTVSQLGYMFIGMGVGAYAAGVFHLMTHAFFKACLFLGSGSVIHAMGGEQDMRKMGGLKQWMPQTHLTFLISTIAIAGIPPTSGFFSKDEILWKAFSSEHGSPLLWLFGFVGAGLTSFYMFRQVFMTFYGENRADHHTQQHLHESPPAMTYPLLILALLAALAGVLGVPHSLGGANRIEEWFAPVFSHGGHAAHEAEHGGALEYVLMILSVGVAGVGFLIARAMYLTKTMSPDTYAQVANGGLYRLLYNKYYVDEFYAATVIAFTMFLSRVASLFDQYVIDFIVNGSATVVRTLSWLDGLFDNYVIDGLVNGVAAVAMGVGGRVRQMQTGSINGYLYVIAVATLVILIYRVM
ncbi:MAG TPA: NADH-quinone oxidoreductase subunit L [Candidatus Kryptonia bacterium]|nr:NADH-quinone oxidoreductase subunit L [Candidatus Kryptonia bacterium]